MRPRCLAYVAAVGMSAASLVSAQADGNVIELFTSQGCSACPAADKLLGQLASDPNLIALTLAIDVWDYLGWKDTLADPRNTVRWKTYAKARGDRQQYTPQVVVNGAEHALGSDRAAIEKALAKSRKKAAVMSVPVKLVSAGGQVTLTVGGAAAGAQVFVAGLSKAVSVAIARGENKGKTVTYYNVVRSFDRLEPWSGQPGSWTLPAPKQDRVDAAAVVLQLGKDDMPGPILGAAIASLR
jgi:hypothetical protein